MLNKIFYKNIIPECHGGEEDFGSPWLEAHRALCAPDVACKNRASLQLGAFHISGFYASRLNPKTPRIFQEQGVHMLTAHVVLECSGVEFQKLLGCHSPKVTLGSGSDVLQCAPWASAQAQAVWTPSSCGQGTPLVLRTSCSEVELGRVTVSSLQQDVFPNLCCRREHFGIYSQGHGVRSL